MGSEAGRLRVLNGRWAVLLLFVLVTTGCTSPGEHRFRRGVRTAAVDPHTWVPLVAAGAIAVADADEDISEWASGIGIFDFGDAEITGDVMLGMTVAAAAATAGDPYAPRIPSPDPWRRIDRVNAAVVGIGSAAVVSPMIKDAIGRKRPKGETRDSMPSGHATVVAAACAVGKRNVARGTLSGRAQWVGRAWFEAMPWLNAWNRIESERHYPTDTLVGHSIGNFIGVLADELIVGRYCRPIVYVNAGSRQGGAALELGIRGEW